MKHLRKFNETFEMNPATMDIVDNDPKNPEVEEVKLKIEAILDELDNNFEKSIERFILEMC